MRARTRLAAYAPARLQERFQGAKYRRTYGLKSQNAALDAALAARRAGHATSETHCPPPVNRAPRVA